MVNAERAPLYLWASSLSLLRLGQRKTNCVSHIKRWNSVCRGDEEHGLAHLKQQRGTAFLFFLARTSVTAPLQTGKMLDESRLQGFFTSHFCPMGGGIGVQVLQFTNPQQLQYMAEE